MKRGHQRCALSAKGNIATTEIADHRDARFRHNLVVIADLQGVRGIADGFMPDRLSVTPDGHHILRTKMFFLHQSLHRIRKQRPQANIQLSKLRKGQLLPLTDTENILFQ